MHAGRRKSRHARAVSTLRYWRVGIGWYVFAILFPVAQWAAAVGIDKLLGRSYELGGSPVFDAFGPQAAAMLPFIILFAFPNALGEELGWRGFALPKLQTRHSALTASIIIGLFWGLWHIPTWAAQKQTDASVLSTLWMVVSTVPAAILFTWVYNGTRGSLLPVCFLHASIAVTGYFVPALPTPTQGAVSWAVAILIVAAGGRAWFAKPSAQTQSHAEPTPDAAIDPSALPRGPR